MTAARDMTKDEALAELVALSDEGTILFEGTPTASSVSLDGWDPDAGEKKNGCVAGVVIRYTPTGVVSDLRLKGGDAPNNMDPRNALAFVRLCQWLRDNYAAVELWHSGITDASRTDCHKMRAVDFCGIKAGETEDDTWTMTVWDDWGSVKTESTPTGTWPDGTGSNVSYRLDDPNCDEFTRDFWRALYEFIASEWQDHTSGPDPDAVPSSIGDHSFIMHPDHPDSNPAPNAKNGREAHRAHIHMQIGKTGAE
jgi:hypothetical protein